MREGKGKGKEELRIRQSDRALENETAKEMAIDYRSTSRDSRLTLRSAVFVDLVQISQLAYPRCGLSIL